MVNFPENCFCWMSVKKRNLKVNFKLKIMHKISYGWLKQCALLYSFTFYWKTFKETTLLHLQDRLVPTKICDIPTTLYWVTTTPMHPARKYCVKCLLLEEEHIGNYFTTTLLSRSKWEKKKRLKIYGVPNCSCWLLKKNCTYVVAR